MGFWSDYVSTILLGCPYPTVMLHLQIGHIAIAIGPNLICYAEQRFNNGLWSMTPLQLRGEVVA